jgi:hypothetical protein
MHILLRLRLSLRKHRCFCRAANKDMIERWFNNKAFLQSSLQTLTRAAVARSPHLLHPSFLQLLAIIDALAELDGGSGNPRLALDAPAERFRMATRASTLAASRKRGRSAGTADITLPSMQVLLSASKFIGLPPLFNRCIRL